MKRVRAQVAGAALSLVLLLAACAPQYRDHGYVPSEEDLAEIVVGETTSAEVADLVGRPSSTGLLAGSGWYYVQSRFVQRGGQAPKEIDREVVAISFDEEGVVENIERFGLEDGQVVVLQRRVTDSNIKGVGFLRQLFGNIGNFTAEQFTQ